MPLRTALLCLMAGLAISACVQAQPGLHPLQDAYSFRVAGTIDGMQRLELWQGGAPVDVLVDFRVGFVGDGEFVRADGSQVPAGALRDVTGNGVTDVLLAGWSGGAHCCLTLRIVELGAEPRFIAHVDIGHGDAIQVEDLDGDGIAEIVLYDPPLAYWNTSFAASPLQRVVLAWDGQAYTFTPGHLAPPPLAPSETAALVHEIRADGSWERRNLPPVAYWGHLADLLYAGRGEEARAFARAAWAGPEAAREPFLRSLVDQLSRSPYWYEVEDAAGMGDRPLWE